MLYQDMMICSHERCFLITDYLCGESKSYVDFPLRLSHQQDKALFLHDRPWISLGIKSKSNGLDIIIHVIAS